jgi:hypothetical protein
LSLSGDAHLRRRFKVLFVWRSARRAKATAVAQTVRSEGVPERRRILYWRGGDLYIE